MKAVKQRVTKTNKMGFLSLPLTGHLNPMTALARKMQSRGNEVVFIGVPDIEPVARAANLEFAPFCEKEFPPGSVAKSWGAVANRQGLDVVRYTCKLITKVRSNPSYRDKAHWFQKTIKEKHGLDVA